MWMTKCCKELQDRTHSLHERTVQGILTMLKEIRKKGLSHLSLEFRESNQLLSRFLLRYFRVISLSEEPS